MYLEPNKKQTYHSKPNPFIKKVSLLYQSTYLKQTHKLLQTRNTLMLISQNTSG